MNIVDRVIDSLPAGIKSKDSHSVYILFSEFDTVKQKWVIGYKNPEGWELAVYSINNLERSLLNASYELVNMIDYMDRYEYLSKMEVLRYLVGILEW